MLNRRRVFIVYDVAAVVALGARIEKVDDLITLAPLGIRRIAKRRHVTIRNTLRVFIHRHLITRSDGVPSMRCPWACTSSIVSELTDLVGAAAAGAATVVFRVIETALLELASGFLSIATPHQVLASQRGFYIDTEPAQRLTEASQRGFYY